VSLVPNLLPLTSDQNRMIFPFHCFSIIFFYSCCTGITVQSIIDTAYAIATQSLSKYVLPSDFPEHRVLKTPSRSISFSGGGSRSYVASIGVLSALTKHDIIKQIRYIGGVSGGAWAATVYTYSQLLVHDSILLGDIIEPEQLNRYILKKMNPQCLRSYASTEIILTAVNYILSKRFGTISAAWIEAVYRTYLQPALIPRNTLFSWSSDTVADIKSRNPHLHNISFLLPIHSHRPYLIVSTSLLGPTSISPYSLHTHNFTRIEHTPLYTGQMKTVDMQYTHYDRVLRKKRGTQQTVGGVLEPFAVVGALNIPSPSHGLESNTTSSVLEVPFPSLTNSCGSTCVPIQSLERVVSASSFAPGTLISMLPSPLADKIEMQASYWSPACEHPIGRLNLVGDGGSTENIPLISFLQRQVSHIILIVNTITPLQPAHKWDVRHDQSADGQIDVDLSAFFGIIPSKLNIEDRLTTDLSKNQVFSRDIWPDFVLQLQAAQAEGRGIVITKNMTTVENIWWGIPRGLNTRLTVMYMGRVHQWEDRLPAALKPLLVPAERRDDLSHCVTDGPFKDFPHFPTTGGSLNYEKANIIANLMGWVIEQQIHQFV